MKVTALTEVSGSGERIRVSTPAGCLEGVWRGKLPIRVNDEVDIELELRLPRTWDAIELIKDIASLSNQEVKSSFIEGHVLSVDDDGVLCLDIFGSPLIIEAVGELPTEIAGSRVRLSAEDLEFYPINL